MNKLFNYLREVKTELFKVVWPTRKETIKLTLIVLVFSLIVAVFLGMVDYALNELIAKLIA